MVAGSTRISGRELGLAGLALVLVAVPWMAGLLPAWERPVWDLWLRLPRPGQAPIAGVAAVAIDDRSVATMGSLPWPRTALAELISAARAHGAVAVVVDLLLVDAGEPVDDARFAEAVAEGPVALAAVVGVDGQWLLPTPAFGGLHHAAHAHVEVEGDGVLRLLSPTKQAEGAALPALAVAGARLGGWDGALEVGRPIRPDFSLAPEAVPQVRACDLLAGAVAGQDLAGTVVFLGVTAAGAGDQFVVPVGSRRSPVPGLLVHASIASSIMRGGLLEIVPAWLVLILTWVVALLMQVSRSRASRLRLSSLGAAVLLIPAFAVLALWFGGQLLPVLTLLAGAVVSAALREAVESMEARKEADAVLESLVSGGVARDLVVNPGSVPRTLRLANTLQRELEQKRRETQRLVSHELKTPLASIVGFGEMLEKYQMSEEELKRTAGLIRSEAERLGTMVRRFLDLERLGDSGRWYGEKTEVDLAELVRSRCEVLRASTSEDRLQLIVDARAVICGVEELLTELVDNLISNALRYSPAEEMVDVELRSCSDQVTLTVKDRGPGIPAEALPRLFERFYRVPGATVAGTGLGLAVVKEVAEWHGGRVEVSSELGRGSEFSVVFKPRTARCKADKEGMS